MADKRDYLAVCNDMGVPIPDFEAAFCVRCLQPECSRSSYGGRFEQRTSTWKERLFDNPERMPEDDPRFARISAQKFMSLNVGPTPSVGAWIDPRSLEGPEPEPPKAKPKSTKKRPVAKKIEAEPETEETPVSEPPQPMPVNPGRPLNSPFSQGAMVGEGPPPRETDSWEVTPPVPPPEEGTPVIVEAGAKIRFSARSGGVKDQ